MTGELGDKRMSCHMPDTPKAAETMCFFLRCVCCYQSTPDRPCICIGGKLPSHMAVIGVLWKLLR
jgi:hypothetical protein